VGRSVTFAFDETTQRMIAEGLSFPETGLVFAGRRADVGDPAAAARVILSALIAKRYPAPVEELAAESVRSGRSH
jgi:hypothetical protein